MRGIPHGVTTDTTAEKVCRKTQVEPYWEIINNRSGELYSKDFNQVSIKLIVTPRDSIKY